MQIEEPFSILPMEAFCDASIGNVLTEMVLAEDKARKQRAAADKKAADALGPASSSAAPPSDSSAPKGSYRPAPVVKKIAERVARVTETVSETVKYAAETVKPSAQAATAAQAFADTLKESREQQLDGGVGMSANADTGDATAWTPPTSWATNANGGNKFKFNPFRKE